MGICRCEEGKSCSVHFFRRVKDVSQYKKEKKAFEKKGKRTPEFEVEEFD
jgi:hypothetical protein